MAYKSRIPQIIAALETNLLPVVNRTGFRVEAGAKRRARVDTGYMRGQIRFYAGKRIGNVKWVTDASTGIMTLDETSMIETGPHEGEVVGGAEYTFWNEHGTAYMSAQPMFIPAAEEARPIFEKEVRAAVRKSVK